MIATSNPFWDGYSSVQRPFLYVMQNQMLIAIGLAASLSAIVGGSLYLGGESEPQIEEGRVVTSAAPQKEAVQAPFMQEYQEFERLLEETRAQRKQQQMKLAAPLAQEVPLPEQERVAAVSPMVEPAPAPIVEPVAVVAPAPVVEKPQAAPVVAKAEPAVAKPQPLPVPSKPKAPMKEEPTAEKQPPVALVKSMLVTEKSKKEGVAQPKEKEKVAAAPKAESKPSEPKAAPVVQPNAKPEKVAKPEVKPQPLPVQKVAERPQKSEVVKPKPKPKKQPKASSKRRNHIQMATFTSKKRATAVVKDLQDAGFNAEVVSVKARGKRYYLVRDYSPKNRKSALALKKVYDEWLKVDSLVRY